MSRNHRTHVKRSASIKDTCPALPPNMKASQSSRFIQRAQHVLRRIDRYHQSGGQEISVQDLNTVRRDIARMISQAQDQTLPPRAQRYRTLSRLIVDQWPLGHKLGIAITELEEEFRKI